MNTIRDNNPKVIAVQIKLAAAGIYALYGGRKGHGFWLYHCGIETAKRLVEHFDPSANLAGKCIQNDGINSGNSHFWTFKDAQKFSNLKEI